MHRRQSRSLLALPCILILLLGTAPPAQGRNDDGDLKAAVTCVITAWNAYDADAARLCYGENAVAVWGGQRKPMDWEFSQRLREFDAAVHSLFRFEVDEVRPPDIHFTLHETNELLDAMGLESVTARWRYTVQSGRVVEEHLLEGDARFRAALQEFTRWGRAQQPEGWDSVIDERGNVRFDGTSARALVTLAKEWARSAKPYSTK